MTDKEKDAEVEEMYVEWELGRDNRAMRWDPGCGGWDYGIALGEKVLEYPLKIEVWEEEQKNRPKSAMKTGKRPKKPSVGAAEKTPRS